MKQVNKIFFGLIVLIAFSYSLAYTQNTDFKPVTGREKIIINFRKKQSTVKTISCSFLQIRYMSYLSAYIESTGNFFYKNNNSIRWEYTEPYQYAIIMNAGKLRVDSNNDDIQYKIKENKYMEMITEIIQNSFRGDIFSNDDYISVLEEDSNQYRLTLIPKNDDIKSIITNVYLHYNKQTLAVSSIIINEPSEDYISISFTKQVFNQPIDNSKFK